MHHIMNLRTRSVVCTQVMHRCRSWTVFSASLLGVNGMLVARHFVMLARERFRESVRRAKFSDRPSRQHCLWLCPSLENACDRLTRLECNNYHILKVSVNGRLHTANERWLMRDSEPLEITRAQAKEYWQGLQVDGGREEILCEGRMKGLEILETTSTITEPPRTPS